MRTVLKSQDIKSQKGGKSFHKHSAMFKKIPHPSFLAMD